MAMPLACEREQQEGELEGEGECGVQIQRGECVEVAVEGKLGLEDLEEEEEEVEEDDEEEEEQDEAEEEDEEEEVDEEAKEDYEEEDDDDEEEDEEEEVFSSGRGESEGDDKEEEVLSRVRVLFKFKRNPPSVIVKYNEDGEQVEFERQGTSDQTESDSEDEEDVEEEEDEVEAGQEYIQEHTRPWHWTNCPRAEFPAELSPAEILENVTARTGVGAIGVRSPGSESSEGLYVVNDHDSYVSIAIAFPDVEEYRVNANRSTMVKLMAQSALKMKLPPCGLYLAVLLLDFYWNHDRSQGRRMDSVQLHVLAYTCLYIASNRFRAPGSARTPDEFCKWAGVAEGSVKGCMIIRQLEAFENLLRPGNVSSVTCEFLWYKELEHNLSRQQLKRFSNRVSKPELHMSDFIRDLEQTDYGIANFNPPAAVKAAHAVYATHLLMAAKLNDPTKIEDPARAMKRMLLLASRSASNKRGVHDMSVDNASSPIMKKRAKIISLPKIAVL